MAQRGSRSRSRQRKGNWPFIIAIAVVGFAVLAAFGVLSGWIVRAVVNDRRDALVLAIGLVATSSILIAVSVVLAPRRRAQGSSTVVAACAALTGAVLLLLGCFGAGGKTSGSEGDRLNRELHGFRTDFIVSLLIACCIAGVITWVVRRRRA